MKTVLTDLRSQLEQIDKDKKDHTEKLDCAQKVVDEHTGALAALETNRTELVQAISTLEAAGQPRPEAREEEAAGQ